MTLQRCWREPKEKMPARMLRRGTWLASLLILICALLGFSLVQVTGAEQHPVEVLEKVKQITSSA